MPKVSVYLPDDLYQAARDQGLSISGLAQRAIEAELQAASTNRWIAEVKARRPRTVGDFSTTELIDDVRSEFGR